MSLPDAFDAGDLGKPLVMPGQRLGRAGRWTAEPFAWAVVDDHHLWPDRVEKPRRSGAVEGAMTARLIHRHLSQSIARTRQLHLLLPIEIGQIEERELAVGEERADHVLILRP